MDSAIREKILSDPAVTVTPLGNDTFIVTWLDKSEEFKGDISDYLVDRIGWDLFEAGYW